ncbi:MAG: 2OG-Fe(II) oxygenase [Deltaproteobacteria bacterium]|nr:2OG-Fe(II) oxygenase [Deltaproteobacteria bacterium]
MPRSARTLMVVDRFASQAKAMRSVFDERFADPRRTNGDRFVWDYWHVPGQYTALRTPAYHYFPAKLYEAFHNHLVWWGRRTLGCHDVSPPWLSCYVEGCRQELHGDVPHGPWAFVFSLTPWLKRVFRGGETLMLRDDVLDYWHGFASDGIVEEPQVLQAVAPLFNRLVVFDPRIPHGVRRVEGTHDPRLGRLVVHGWFVQPRPFIEGPLQPAVLERRIDDLSAAIERLLAGGIAVSGMMSLKVNVTAKGAVAKVAVLSDNTRVPAAYAADRARLLRAITATVRAWTFPRRPAPSAITLPLVFAS